MKFLTLMCLMLVVVKTSGKARQCGFPGEPENGYVMPRKDLYNEDEQVTYGCKSPYATLMSESSEQMRRTCKCSGLWNGTIPTCNYYDLLWDHPLTGSGIADFSNMVDDDKTTCSRLFLPNGELSSEITVFNASIESMDGVQLQVHFGKIEGLSSETTMMIEIEDHSMAGKFSCSHKGGFAPIPVVEFAELSINCTRGQHVSMSDSWLSIKLHFSRPNGQRNLDISVCSLRVLTLIIKPSCGEPERPTNGNVSVALGISALYSCDIGYELFGQAHRECSLSKGEMMWTHIMPICITPSEKKCRTLPKIRNGDLINTGCLIAVVVCYPGYTLGSTNRLAYCSESTSWTWKWNITDQGFVSHGDECVTRKENLILVYVFASIGLVLLVLMSCCIYKGRNTVSDETHSPLLRVFFRRK